MDFLNIVPSVSIDGTDSFDVSETPVGAPGLIPNCDDGKCGECTSCTEKKVIEVDVEAQTPRVGSNEAFSDIFNFSQGENDYEGPRIYSEPASTSTDAMESETKSEPIHQPPDASTRTVIPPSWPFGPLPSIPSIPFTSSDATPPVEYNSRPIQEGTLLPIPEPESNPPALGIPLVTKSPSKIAMEAMQNIFSPSPPPPPPPAPSPPKSKNKDETDSSPRPTMNVTSARTVHASNTLMDEVSQSQHSMVQKVQPIELGPKRHDSVALFAKPAFSRDLPVEEEEARGADVKNAGDDKRISIHDSGKDGEASEFEVCVEYAL